MTPAAQALAAQLVRNVDQPGQERFSRLPCYDSVGARLGTGTAAQKLGASIDIVASGMRSCPYHFHHAQEEMFVILAGSGTLRVAGEMLPLQTGDVIFIPPGPAYPHQLINTSNAPLKYLSVSTREQPEVVEYPDSGKYLASAGVGALRSFEVIQRLGETLDYWDGES